MRHDIKPAPGEENHVDEQSKLSHGNGGPNLMLVRVQQRVAEAVDGQGELPLAAGGDLGGAEFLGFSSKVEDGPDQDRTIQPK